MLLPCSLRSLRLAFVALLALPLPMLASPAGEALRELAREDWIERRLSLTDLGLSSPIVLNRSSNHQEFYLPVPRGIDLNNATLTVDGNYLRGEEVPATLTLSVDGRPVLAQRLQDHDGVLDRSLPIDARGRDSGFVRLSVEWGSAIGLRLCETDRPTANVLTLTPSTRLAYRFSSEALISLDDAWSTLPGKPVLLIAHGKIDQASYDSAWRMGVALERAGKRVRISTLPQPGDTVRLAAAANVPAALRDIPAFAALRDHDRHTLADNAQLGAWIVLNGLRADLAIADATLTQQINHALDALAQQLQTDSDAAQALTQWRQRYATLAQGALANKQVQLSTLGRQATIAIAPDAGAQAAAIFDGIWKRVLTGPNAIIHAAGPQLDERNATQRLAVLGGPMTAFDVVTRGEWNATFPLSMVSTDGRIPGELVLDLAAAPGASVTPTVASVTWNDVLIDARQLREEGRPERMSARVPGYALGISNHLRITFQRQPVSPNCAETPQGYPVNVLPSSFLRASNAEPDGTFIGLLPLLAGNPQLIIPHTYLNTPAATLPRVIRLATASALSPARAELITADPSAAFVPSKPFLSMEVPLQGAHPLIEIIDDKRLRAGGVAQPWLDVEGPQALSAASVVQAGKQAGIIWYALGQQPENIMAPFVLSRGDAVVLGARGPLAWIDTTDPGLSQPPGMGGTTFYEWRSYIAWGLPVLAALLLLALLLAIVVRRARKNHDS